MTVGHRPNHGGKSQGNPHPLPPPTGEDQPSTNRAGARGQGSGAEREAPPPPSFPSATELPLPETREADAGGLERRAKGSEPPLKWRINSRFSGDAQAQELVGPEPWIHEVGAAASETEEELLELHEIRSHKAGEGDTGPPSSPEEGGPPPGNREAPDQPPGATHVTAGPAGRPSRAKPPPKSRGSNRSVVRGTAFSRLARRHQTTEGRQQDKARDHGPGRGLAGNRQIEGEERASRGAREPEGENGGSKS